MSIADADEETSQYERDPVKTTSACPTSSGSNPCPYERERADWSRELRQIRRDIGDIKEGMAKGAATFVSHDDYHDLERTVDRLSSQLRIVTWVGTIVSSAVIMALVGGMLWAAAQVITIRQGAAVTTRPTVPYTLPGSP